MSVCTCGEIKPKGDGWCRKCYVFWSAWWLRYVKDTCDCVECDYRRRLQPAAQVRPDVAGQPAVAVPTGRGGGGGRDRRGQVVGVLDQRDQPGGGQAASELDLVIVDGLAVPA